MRKSIKIIMIAGLLALSTCSIAYAEQDYGYQFEALPYTLNTTHYVSVDCNGAASYDKFLYSVSGQSYADWSAQMENGENGKAALTEEQMFSYADPYIAQAISETRFSGCSYELVRKDRAYASALGGFSAAYYVYFPTEHSYKYLTITFAKDLMGDGYTYSYSGI